MSNYKNIIAEAEQHTAQPISESAIDQQTGHRLIAGLEEILQGQRVSPDVFFTTMELFADWINLSDLSGSPYDNSAHQRKNPRKNYAKM